MTNRVGREVVITGVGMITPVGVGVDAAWNALLAGTSGGGVVTHFETDERYATRIACEVKGFDPSGVLEPKEIRRFDRFAQFALVAAEEAMGHAGLLEGGFEGKGIDAGRFGVIFGSGIGGIQTFEEQCKILQERGPGRVSPFFVPMFIPDIAPGLISIRYGARGANFTTVSACASSAHAIGEAFRSIQRGDSDVMIAGGTEATITPLTMAGFAAMKAMSTRNDEPETASRPFDATRDGFVMGEGAGALVLEAREVAEARGATILGQVAGYGLSADAYHITAPAPDGAGAQAAMRMALSDGGLDPSEVDYVNAHGTSTPHNDRSETAAIRTVLGSRAEEIVVGSTKSMTGHLLGAAGAVEAVVSVLACGQGRIPPTINLHEPDPDCDLDYAPEGVREREVRVALSNSFGFGGHNVCLAFRRWDGS
ncbi:MAG: beta-ketoacyl-[acyl-carrier-protein] synthase II [Gemmatimonadales bacterium]|nr:MAG: beta-ketoacyl-[acyl-carrier-protein] synthase II [Gemmatimonadales bacterium]